MTREASNAAHTWIESEEDRQQRLADYRLWAYRYQRGAPCRKCMWPFPNSNHVCLEHDTSPTDADWGA